MLVNVHVPISTVLGVSRHPRVHRGFGAIDPATAREIAADATRRRILTDPASGTVLDVGRTRYRPPTAMPEHIQVRDRTCSRPGCDQPADRCDLDHREPFRPGQPTGGDTSAANLTPFCRHHHRELDGGGSHLTEQADGTWAWTTPLGRTYHRPKTTVFDLGDNQTSAPEYQNPDPRPKWISHHTAAGCEPAAPPPVVGTEVPDDAPPF